MVQAYDPVFVRVDRTRTPTQIIDATGRRQGIINKEALAEMPLDGRTKDKVEFFELDYDPTPKDLDDEYKARGLRPDAPAVAQAMTDDPAFADEQPVVVQWRDGQGRACCAFFSRWDIGRLVDVHRSNSRWRRSFRFAGVRK